MERAVLQIEAVEEKLTIFSQIQSYNIADAPLVNWMW